MCGTAYDGHNGASEGKQEIAVATRRLDREGKRADAYADTVADAGTEEGEVEVEVEEGMALAPPALSFTSTTEILSRLPRA